MNHIRQPEGSSLCGHAVLAMVLDLSLDKACDRMGHSRSTRTRELVKALGPAALGSRLTRLSRRHPMPHTCVLKVCWKGTHKSHFVLKTGSDIHDPLLTGPVTLEGWSQVLKKSGRVTSFLPVRRVTEWDTYFQNLADRINHQPLSIGPT
jgi:hypothetical protein